CDINQDGHEDLLIGSGQGGKPAVFLGDGQGGFKRAEDSLPAVGKPCDGSSILAWNPESGQTSIIAGLANPDGINPGDSSVGQWCWPTNSSLAFETNSEVRLDCSVGPLALGDIFGDGDLGLFVGGRAIMGRWPEPASSRIYRNRSGKFHLDELNS